MFGPIRIGPVIGAGFPNVLSLGATAKLWGTLGIGFNYGLTPEVRVDHYGEADVRYREYDVYARLCPFKGGFYVGAGLGEHRVQGTSTNALSYTAEGRSNDYEMFSRGSVRSLIVTPQVGYFRSFSFGLALGFGVGAHVPVRAGRVTFHSIASKDLPPGVESQARAQVHDTLVKVGKTPLPVVDVKVGWLF